MTATVATDLVATAMPLAEGIDLLALDPVGEGFLFARGRAGIAGIGTAMHLNIPPGPDQVGHAAEVAARALASIRREGELAPVAVGALPFDGTWPATLVVPRLLAVRDPDGTSRGLSVTPAGTLPAQPGRLDVTSAPGMGLGGRLRLTSVPSPTAYTTAVGLARARIAAGELKKVVLARMLVVRGDAAFDRQQILRMLRASEPDAYLYACGPFVGATPELVAGRRGSNLTSIAVAGTAARGKDEDEIAARLLASPKERGEHQLVVAAIREAIAGACDVLEVPDTPSVHAMRTVMHLVTTIRGRLTEPTPGALQLAARLHPTPAVCGTPREAAHRLISELEVIDRGLYSGLVGWVDADGNGEWALSLRCAEVQARLLLLFAGAGIVAESDPAAELAETDAKFDSVLRALAAEGAS